VVTANPGKEKTTSWFDFLQIPITANNIQTKKVHAKTFLIKVGKPRALRAEDSESDGPGDSKEADLGGGILRRDRGKTQRAVEGEALADGQGRGVWTDRMD
jgi:hypothetical protein